MAIIMNLPTTSETQMMHNRYAAPKQPIKFWRVMQGKSVLYENVLVSLCYHFKNTNGLVNSRVIAVR